MNNKYVTFGLIVIVIVTSGYFLRGYVKKRDDRSYSNNLKEAYTLLLKSEEDNSKEQAIYTCQEYNLERSSNYPENIKGKSVDEIRELILQQSKDC